MLALGDGGPREGLHAVGPFRASYSALCSLTLGVRPYRMMEGKCNDACQRLVYSAWYVGMHQPCAVSPS